LHVEHCTQPFHSLAHLLLTPEVISGQQQLEGKQQQQQQQQQRTMRGQAELKFYRAKNESQATSIQYLFPQWVAEESSCINLTLPKSCVFHSSSFIFGLNSTKLGMLTLPDVPHAFRFLIF
jgi:hypothetical protein